MVLREAREGMNIYNNDRAAKKEFSLYCNIETAIYETKEEEEKERLRIYNDLSVACCTEYLSVHILFRTEDFSIDTERYVCMYVCMYRYMYAHTHIYMFISTHPCSYIYIYTYVCIHIYIYIYIYICMNLFIYFLFKCVHKQ